MTSYKLIQCLLSTSFFHEDSLVINKFTRLQGSFTLQVQSLNLQTRDNSFFILNFWAAFQGKVLHMARNQSLTHEILSCRKCFKYMLKLKHKKPTSSCNSGGTTRRKTCIIPLVGGSHLSLGCWLYISLIYIINI